MSEATLTRRGARRGPVGRAVLGTGRLWLGAIALVALRMVADLARTLGAWSEHGPAWAELVAWIVLLVAVGALIAAIRALGERLPNRMLLGGTATLLSFVTEQTGRGLQIEAVVATPWMWALALRVPGVEVYYDMDILTYQLRGPGVEAITAATTPTLALLVAGVLAIAAVGESFISAELDLAIRGEEVGGAPRLSAQERRVMALYGAGEPVKSVAYQLGISEETAKSYLKRIREKYRLVGVDVGEVARDHEVPFAPDAAREVQVDEGDVGALERGVGRAQHRVVQLRRRRVGRALPPGRATAAGWGTGRW